MAIAVLSRLDSATRVLKAIDDQRRRVRDMREEVDGYETSARSVATNSGSRDLPEDALALVQTLNERLDAHEERRRGIVEARRRVSEAEQRIAEALGRFEEAAAA